MKRRSLFSLLLASSAGAALAGGRSLSCRSVLVLLELRGGNDGLNTVAPLLPLWQSRRLAVALGVGWPRPNRSHFKAADQWATSSPSGEGTGWLAASLAALAAGLERLPNRLIGQYPSLSPPELYRRVLQVAWV